MSRTDSDDAAVSLEQVWSGRLPWDLPLRTRVFRRIVPTNDILLRRLEQGAHARDDLAAMSCVYETELEALQNMSERLSLLEMQALDSFEVLGAGRLWSRDFPSQWDGTNSAGVAFYLPTAVASRCVWSAAVNVAARALRVVRLEHEAVQVVLSNTGN